MYREFVAIRTVPQGGFDIKSKKIPKCRVPVPTNSGQAVQALFSNAPLGGSIYEAATATASFLNNFRRMRSANRVDADKYYHCKANAREAQLGPHGRVVAKIISEGREISDRFKYKYIRKEKNDAELDQEPTTSVGKLGPCILMPISARVGMSCAPVFARQTFQSGFGNKIKRPKLRLWHVIVLAILVAPVLFKGQIITFLESDICLDSGGRWDYELSDCDYGTKEECLLRGNDYFWNAFAERCRRVSEPSSAP